MKIIILSLALLWSISAIASNTILLQGYEQWINDEFEGEHTGSPALRMEADPDHDGITNLMEYALDSDPLFPSNEALPTAVRQGDRLTFSFVKDRSKTDIVYHVQTSSDLTHWTNVSTDIVTAKGSLERHRAVFPLTESRSLFMRLLVRPVSFD